MTVFWDTYSDESTFLEETLKAMNVKFESVLFSGDSMPSEKFTTLCEAWVYKKDTAEYQEKELHCTFLPTPSLWQVRMDYMLGAVYQLDKRKATIYYREPVNKRIVERVEWLSDAGYVYKIDYYNKYGWKYCCELKGIYEGVSMRTYYNSKGEEIISQDLRTGFFTVFESGIVKAIYDSPFCLEKELYVEVMKSDEVIILTSWRQVCLLREIDVEGNANVKVLLSEEKDIEKYLEYSKTNRAYPMFILSLARTVTCGNAEERKDSRLCYISAVDKALNSYGDILILTSLDQLEGVESLITNFPKIKFHIAAHTLVSDKLLALENYSNAKIYPQISKEQLQHLLESCSFYLDISLGWEIHNIVLRASMYKLLILGFEHTLCNPYYVLPECVFSRNHCQGLIEKLRSVIGNDDELRTLLDKQYRMAEESVKALVL